MLFTKSLRLSCAAKLARGTGGVINLQSNDTQKLFWLPFHVLQLMLVPLQVRLPCHRLDAEGAYLSGVQGLAAGMCRAGRV